MASLDTNVLVRYLVQHDAKQLALTKRLIRKSVTAGQTLFVPVTVFLELEWVLRSSFKYTKETTLKTLDGLLAADELSFESESAIEHARILYAETSADFSDCVHIALAYQAGEPPLWTFDVAAARVKGASLVA